MTEAYVFMVFPTDWKPGHPEPMYEVIRGKQAMLDRVVTLTKHKVKFSVYEVGACLGDYS